MTRYADPTRCPDCGARITPAATHCATCALLLRGETASQLFSALLRADELLVSLRAASRPTAAAAGAATSGASAGVPATASSAPAVPFPTGHRPAGRARRGLSAATVPQLLLGLGALCLLVAALVFLAVTWSVLGVGGRTATLVVLTGVAGVLSATMTRRRLRAAAETFALVGYGLLALDVVGADNAGWFGDLSGAGLLVVAGVVLGVAGAAGAVAVRRSGSALVAGEAVAALGVALVALGIGLAQWLPVSPSLLAATVVAAAGTVLAHRLGLGYALLGSALVTALSWLGLVSEASSRVVDADTYRTLWADAEVWPLLAAAALVAVTAALRALPVTARVAASGAAALLLAAAVVRPLLDEGATVATLAALGVLVVAGAAARLLPRPWGLAAAPSQAVAGCAVLTVALALAATAGERLAHAATPAWSGAFADRLADLGSSDAPAPWLLPLTVLALVGTLGTLLAAVGGSALRDAVRVADARLLAALAAGSVVATVALLPVPVVLVTGLLLAGAAAYTGWWLRDRSAGSLLAAAGFALAGLLVALHAPGHTLVASAGLLVLGAVVHLRSTDRDVAAVAGATVAATLAGSVWTIGHLLDADPSWVAVTGLLLLGATVLVAPYAPDAWWASPDATWCRTGLEAGAAASALPLATVGVLLAPSAERETWAAVLLTVAGVAVTVMSLLRADRRLAGWAGGALLALASWVRLWDLGVSGPEAYTLPSAAALVLVGLVHLRRTPGSTTMTALAPGLSLALVPSLLWVLGDPSGPRPLLLGLACLGLVLAGLRLGWTAPLATGAVVGALLVLRLAAPYVGSAVPRWVLIGLAGAVLIGLGASWERRLVEARQLMASVRGLR